MRLVTAGDQTVTVSSPLMTSGDGHRERDAGQVTPSRRQRPDRHDRGRHVQRDRDGARRAGRRRDRATRSTVHFTSSDVAGRPARRLHLHRRRRGRPHLRGHAEVGRAAVRRRRREVGGTVNGGSFVNVTPAAARSLALAGGGGAIGVARPITIVARDAYGNTATGYTGTVHVTSSDPAAVLPADTALVNGVATVNVTLLTVGTQTITATDVADPTLTGTVSSDATPPVAALFAVAGYPGDHGRRRQHVHRHACGTPSARSPPATPARSTSPAPTSRPGLPASYTFTAADAGVHTFTATLQDGRHAVDHRPRLDGRPDRDAAGHRGQPGGVRRLPALGAQSATDSKGHMLVTAGDSISLTVKAVDAFGNAVAGYNGKVHVQQHRRPGRPAGRLHLHRGGRRRPHLHGRPEDGHAQRRRLVVQRGRRRRTPPRWRRSRTSR